MLAQAYHWTLGDISSLSYVQVLMLQHAAGYNRKLLDKRLEEGRKSGSLSPTEGLADSEYGGKAFKDLTSDELIMLAGSDAGKAPKVIKIRKDPDAQAPTEQGE